MAQATDIGRTRRKRRPVYCRMNCCYWSQVSQNYVRFPCIKAGMSCNAELMEMDGQREELTKLEEQLAESEAKLMLQEDKNKGLVYCAVENEILP